MTILGNSGHLLDVPAVLEEDWSEDLCHRLALLCLHSYGLVAGQLQAEQHPRLNSHLEEGEVMCRCETSRHKYNP